MSELAPDLFAEILGALEKAGALDELVLIGSWCLVFYRECFENSPLIPIARIIDGLASQHGIAAPK